MAESDVDSSCAKTGLIWNSPPTRDCRHAQSEPPINCPRKPMDTGTSHLIAQQTQNLLLLDWPKHCRRDDARNQARPTGRRFATWICRAVAHSWFADFRTPLVRLAAER